MARRGKQRAKGTGRGGRAAADRGLHESSRAGRGADRRGAANAVDATDNAAFLASMGAPLLRWYRRARRRLPWREDPTPYAVWVSEVMLQQTRVETVIPYYLRFLERFPTLGDLARAPLDDVLALWSGLGYYRRARSLHEGARHLVEAHAGAFPRDLKAALDVPGVGPYTAGAVLSIAYNLPVPVVDGNVERVLCRAFGLFEDPRTRGTSSRLRSIALSMMPVRHASEFNQALMELGALVCTPASPACPACPLRGRCAARTHGWIAELPRRAVGRAPVRLLLDCLLVRLGDRYLIEERRGREILGGLWLFPLVEAGVAPPREGEETTPSGELLDLTRRLGIEAGPLRFLGEVAHAVTYRRMRVRVFLADLDGLGALREPEGSRWTRLEDLGTTVAVPSLALKISRLSRQSSGPVPPRRVEAPSPPGAKPPGSAQDLTGEP